jgi:hypothetical protein
LSLSLEFSNQNTFFSPYVPHDPPASPFMLPHVYLTSTRHGLPPNANQNVYRNTLSGTNKTLFLCVGHGWTDAR